MRHSLLEDAAFLVGSDNARRSGSSLVMVPHLGYLDRPQPGPTPGEKPLRTPNMGRAALRYDMPCHAMQAVLSLGQ